MKTDEYFVAYFDEREPRRAEPIVDDSRGEKYSKNSFGTLAGEREKM